jgi:hypothetical protein
MNASSLSRRSDRLGFLRVAAWQAQAMHSVVFGVLPLLFANGLILPIHVASRRPC